MVVRSGKYCCFSIRVASIERWPTFKPFERWPTFKPFSFRKMTHIQTTYTNRIALRVGEKGARPAEVGALASVFEKKIWICIQHHLCTILSLLSSWYADSMGYFDHSHHPSISAYAVSELSRWMQVFAARLTITGKCEGIHWRTSLICSPLFLQLFFANVVQSLGPVAKVTCCSWRLYR